MGSKALLVLVMLLATILLIFAEVAPKDFDEKFDQGDGKLVTNGVDESKYGFGGFGPGRGPWYGGPWRGGYGRPWRGGYGWGYCPYGCCYWGYYGRCRRCCYYPRKHVGVNTDAKPQN